MRLFRVASEFHRNSRTDRLLGLVFLAAVLIGSMATAEAQQVGAVIQQSGTNIAERNGHIVPLAIGAKIHLSDRIVTAPESRIKVEFNDGTIVAIGADSALVVAQYATREDESLWEGLVTLLRGILRATVSSEPSRDSFNIGTRVAVASVRSTDFMIEVEGVRSAVVVLDGQVRVTGLEPRGIVDLGPGDGTDVVRGVLPTAPKTWGQARVDAFLARTAVP